MGNCSEMTLFCVIIVVFILFEQYFCIFGGKGLYFCINLCYDIQMKKVLLLFLWFTILSFGVTNMVSVQAQKASIPPIVGHENKSADAKGQSLLPGPSNSNKIQDYVNDDLLPGLTNTIFIFILSISVGAIIIAGIFYIISNGDTEKTKRAKDIILWTILGVVIAAISYVLIRIVIMTNFNG